MTASGLDLRELVASIVREVLAGLVHDVVLDTVSSNVAPGQAARPATPSPSGGPKESMSERAGAGIVAAAPGGALRTHSVRITDDEELDRFARQLLVMFENPKSRQDLRAGRLNFLLSNTSGPSAGGPSGPTMRIDRGAVTERQVKAAAEAGHSIILGHRAVLTPLGREKARALNVHVEKERRC